MFGTNCSIRNEVEVEKNSIKFLFYYICSEGKKFTQTLMKCPIIFFCSLKTRLFFNTLPTAIKKILKQEKLTNAEEKPSQIKQGFFWIRKVYQMN